MDIRFIYWVRKYLEHLIRFDMKIKEDGRVVSVADGVVAVSGYYGLVQIPICTTIEVNNYVYQPIFSF